MVTGCNEIRARWLMLGLVAAMAPAARGGGPDSSQPMAAAVQPFIDHHIISGAVVAVANRDKVLDLEAVGYADLAAHRPMRPDTLFWIASMSKSVTATAMMMLVDRGKVGLDDPAEKYLPEFKGQMVVAYQDADHLLLKKPRHPILVRDLLSHTSGLLKRYPLEYREWDYMRLRDIVRSYAISPLPTEPGTAYNYSNPGINTVGRIVEVVSGMPFEEYLAKKIFDPLGMTSTTFFPTHDQLQRLATTYRVEPGQAGLDPIRTPSLMQPLDDPQRQTVPSAGLFSTAGDLVKFCQMILRGGSAGGRRYLSENAVGLMSRQETPDFVGVPYGFGWSTGLGNHREGFGHGGALMTYMLIDPQVNLVAIFLVQHVDAWTTPEEKKVWPTFTREAYAIASPGLVVGEAHVPGADPAHPTRSPPP